MTTERPGHRLRMDLLILRLYQMGKNGASVLDTAQKALIEHALYEGGSAAKAAEILSCPEAHVRAGITRHGLEYVLRRRGDVQVVA